MAETYTGSGIGAGMGMGGNAEQAAEAVDRPADKIAQKIPSTPYFFATPGSILVSAGLFAAGKKTASLFVGLWAPTVLNMGMYNKLLRIAR